MDLKFRSIISSIFFSALIFFSVDCFAQPGGEPCPQEPCPPTPISGIEILIAGGAAFGIRKLIKAKNQEHKC